MAYRPPAFNIRVNIWRFGNSTSNPPDLVSSGNLAYGRRAAIPSEYGANPVTDAGLMFLLLPYGTDVRDSYTASGYDTVEVPAGTGRLYAVSWVDDAGKGFANEHRVAAINKIGVWPTPISAGGGGGPVPPPPALPAFSITNSPTMPAVLSYTAPGGPIDLWVFEVDPLGTGPTVTSSSVGLLVLTDHSIAIVNGAGNVGVVLYYRYSPIAGAETLTITGVAAASFVMAVRQPTKVVLDANGTFSGIATNPAVTSGAMTGSNEEVSVGMLFADTTSGGTLNSPFAFDSVLTGMVMLDSSGSAWYCYFVSGVGISLPSVTVTFTTTPPTSLNVSLLLETSQ